jgi:4,5:9,10-diseco-3-hydroxy-5,9,17-trioxoandrosta-1(10),2-diene-4-oate hydrolase
MKAPQDRYIKVGKINTRYWAEGSQGSPLIFIHGIGEYIENWLPSFGVLGEKYRVYAVDLLGHGRTDKPLNVSYKIADLTQFVKDFMATLGIEHAHVVGHSLGGAIGTRLALVQPAVVNKLVLVGSAGLGKEAAMVLRIMNLPILGEMLSRPSHSGSANLAKLLVHDPAVMTDELIELSYQMSLLPGMQKSFLRVLRANGNLFGQSKSVYGPNVQGLPSITKPVLVVWGRQDQIIPVAHAEVATKNLPNVRVQIFDSCGHFPMLEHTQSFNELLLEFLGN